MENFRDFLGKDLDDCIGKAMEYYGCGRENLEIELIQEAKTGIFGIVCARKAKIRARRAHVQETVASLLNAGGLDLAAGSAKPQLERPAAAPQNVSQGKGGRQRRQAPPDVQSQCGQTAQTGMDGQDGKPDKTAGAGAVDKIRETAANAGIREKGKKTCQANAADLQPRTEGNARVRRNPGHDKPVPERGAREKTAQQDDAAAVRPGRDEVRDSRQRYRDPRPEEGGKQTAAAQDAREDFTVNAGEDAAGDDLENSSWPSLPLSELDGEMLREQALGITAAILEPLAGRSLQMAMETSQRSVRIHVEWEGDAGLLIGRDGQTLAAAQYLVARILSRAMKSVIRVQLDIGGYRARQEDKLCEMARALAGRVLQLGRPLSTAPLSAYHRRLVHLCLQENELVQTRSIGDGPMKKVLVSPRRPCQP